MPDISNALEHLNTSTDASGAINQGALSGYDLGQKLATLHALRGVDLGNQESVQHALSSLTSIGAVDQAKGVMDLAYQRGVNNASLPVATGALDLAAQRIARERQQPDQASQGDTAKHAQLLQEGAAASQDLLTIADPAQRAARAAQYKTYFQREGVPEENIDGVLSDLSDPALRSHVATMHAELQHQAATNGPGYQRAAANLNSELADPVVMGVLQGKAGIDVSPGLTLDASLTAPVRSETAQAAFAGPIAQSTAAGGDTGHAQVGSPPVPGAQGLFDGAGNVVGWRLPDGTLQAVQGAAQANAGGAAAGGAPYQNVDVPTGVPGQTRTINRQQFHDQTAGNGGFTTATGAQTHGALGTADSSITHAEQFEAASANWRTQKATIDNLRTAATGLATGPLAPWWASVGQLAAQFGYKGLGPPSANETANYEEVRKLTLQIAAQQGRSFGLPNTNMTTSLTEGATPSEKNSPAGIQRLLGVIEGNYDYIGAMMNAWQAYKNKGNTGETFENFRNVWSQTFDPRIWQGKYMSDADRARLRRSMPTYDHQVNALSRLGYLAP